MTESDKAVMQRALDSKNRSAKAGQKEAAVAFVTYDGSTADLNELARYVVRLEYAIGNAIAQPEDPHDKLLRIIAAAYQIAGACDLPDHVLDVLANPEMATQEQIAAMLPFVPSADEHNFCPRCGKRLGGTDDIHTCTLPVDPKETK